MEFVLYLSISYLICGICHASKQLNESPMNRPMWALKPTPKMVFFAGLTWPAHFVMNTPTGNRFRSLAFGLMGSCLQITINAFMIWACWNVSAMATESLVLQSLLFTGLAIISVLLILPLLVIPVMVLSLVLAIPIDAICWVYEKIERLLKPKKPLSKFSGFDDEIASWPQKKQEPAWLLYKAILDRNTNDIERLSDAFNSSEVASLERAAQKTAEVREVMKLAQLRRYE